MTHVISPKKLIEVALPLDAINAAAAREKSIRHGHPSTLHLWWARRPLAAARAVIFGQLVHDPEDLWRCQNPGVEPKPQNKTAWTKSRARLFKIIEDLVKWENTTNEDVLNAARNAIRESWLQTCELNKNHSQAKELFDPKKMPGLHDPFAGGGAIPLEAQRLGLEAHASDLNPVAVLINKAMIEIPPKFAGLKPVHPDVKKEASTLARPWKGAEGLAEDVRRYGKWMRDEAEKRIGHLYPKVEITKEMVAERPDLKPLLGQKLTVIAWLWARTVKSPNPAYSHIDVPLVSSYVLSTDEAYVQPVIEKNGYKFTVKSGKPVDLASIRDGTKVGRGGNFQCIMSSVLIPVDSIREQGIAGTMSSRLLAIVAEGPRGRVYLSPTETHEEIAKSAIPPSQPELEINHNPRDIRTQLYGLTKYGDLFSKRQLVALTAFSDLVGEALGLIKRDSLVAGMKNDDRALEEGGMGAYAYAQAVGLYLAFSLSKCSDYWSGVCSWHNSREIIRNTFGRQAIPMTWDYAEANPCSDSTGNWLGMVEWVYKAFRSFATQVPGYAFQEMAQTQSLSSQKFISTEPPYYDNIGYADLSDFFYVWLRPLVRSTFPALFTTISVPKSEELVATPYRHGSRDAAEAFFMNGMTQAIHSFAEHGHCSAPVTIYYAFKQQDESTSGTNNTGWEAFLGAVIRAGFSITGTWPMRTELSNRMIGSGTNALASSVVLVCRRRDKAAGTISRRQFQRMLNEALPIALDTMTRESEGLHSPVAPVDLSQAIVGPGMAIFSKYEAVLEADGSPMSVKTALQLINRFLAEDDFDPDTQFCLHWFEQHGWETGKFGEADTLARAKGTSVEGVKQAGVVEAGGGNVRLLRWKEYPTEWEPASDQRLSVWETLHHLIRVFTTAGDSGASLLLKLIGDRAEPSRQLAYRLYTICERKGWAADARYYNDLVAGWKGIEAAHAREMKPMTQGMF